MTKPKKYALHSKMSREDKIKILKRANAILGAGYIITQAEKRTGYNIDDMRLYSSAKPPRKERPIK